ncbi:MAG: hypothetical protein JWN73_2146 [Betaproteobacteria bacterium]|nr:hypothetical protein [Betaproteobacteria bacterium]
MPTPSNARRIGLWLLAAFFIVGGLLHFAFPTAYAGIMPAWLPWHSALVAVSGVCEIAGGAGLLLLRTQRAAGWGLILLSLAVLPANLQMLLNYHAAETPLWQQILLALRLPLQAPLIWWIWCAMRVARG